MLSKHGALTGIKRIASTVCLFTREGTCIYYATKNKEPVLVPGCFISTTLLSPSVAETKVLNKNKKWTCPQLNGLKQECCGVIFSSCLQLSAVEERGPPARLGACLHCPLAHGVSAASQGPLLYLPQKEHQKSCFEMSEDRTSVCVISVGKTAAECFQKAK